MPGVLGLAAVDRPDLHEDLQNTSVKVLLRLRERLAHLDRGEEHLLDLGERPQGGEGWVELEAGPA